MCWYSQFDGRKEHASVQCDHHGLLVLGISAIRKLFLSDFEPRFLDRESQFLPTQFQGILINEIRKMVQQWPVIHPNSV